MPDIRTHGNDRGRGGGHCERGVGNGQRLEELRCLIESLRRLEQSAIAPNTAEILSHLVRKVVYLIASVPDEYFVTDACELTHETLVDFRVLMGHFDTGRLGTRRLQLTLRDVFEGCEELMTMYEQFLHDPAYQGTRFPNKNAIREMRRLRDVVKDAAQVIDLTRPKPETPAPRSPFIVDMFESMPMEEDTTHVLQEYLPDRLLSPTPTIDSFSSSVSSVTSESNMLKSYTAPQTPVLKARNLEPKIAVLESRSGMLESRSAVPAPSSAVPAPKSGVPAPFLAAMTDVLVPPTPPPSKHGRIAYMPMECGHSAPSPIAMPRGHGGYSRSLRPPILIDDDGDILPSNPPPPPSAGSILNHDDLPSLPSREFTRSREPSLLERPILQQSDRPSAKTRRLFGEVESLSGWSK